MSRLQRLPKELRQHIIIHTLPVEITAEELRPQLILPLLLICKWLHNDALEVLSIWSPICLLRDPDIKNFGSQLSSCRNGFFKSLSLRVQLFATLDMKAFLRSEVRSTIPARHHVERWIDCIRRLPKEIINSVAVDLTPCPQSLRVKNPELVVPFVEEKEMAKKMLLLGTNMLAKLLRDVDSHFNHENRTGVAVPVLIDGQFGSNSASIIEQIVVKARRALFSPIFIGTYTPFEPDKDMPDSLMLTATFEAWRLDRFALKSLRRSDSDTMGDSDSMGDLGYWEPISPRWTSRSRVAYHINALMDEAGAKADLFKVLELWIWRLAKTMRHKWYYLPGIYDATQNEYYDFPRSRPSERRSMIHTVCWDLWMQTASYGDNDERFVRVYAVPEAEDESMFEWHDVEMNWRNDEATAYYERRRKTIARTHESLAVHLSGFHL
ncbi:putative R3H domain-containing protein [Seiridium unicorne]|uniref:R3H domain-containing protein n=1 Tax=Seiridium unicorne TaxID=138068 RepID=A0ABR2VG41_9PEZI